jgi:putative membrane protein
MWHIGDGMGWWMIWGVLMMALFWGGLIALVLWAVQSVARRDQGQVEPPVAGRASPTPLDIVRERYARGEISREEFETMKADLEGADRS